MTMNDKHCAGCGMTTETVREYHPFAVCAMFKILLNSNQVRQNLRPIIEYGMRAQRAGVSIDDALGDFNTVFDAKEIENGTGRRYG